MTPYPATLSIDDWQIIVGLMSGQKPTAPHAVHACWDAVGFCLGQALPDPTAAPPAPVAMTRTEATAHVKNLSLAGPRLSLTPAQWIALGLQILQLLGGLLGGVTPPAA